MKIYVDSRERDKILLFKKFVSSGKCQLIDSVVVGTYDTSDVHSGDGLVGIERKGTDYMESIFNGQMDKQLKELKENFSYPLLFIEYEGLEDIITRNKGISPKKIAGSLTSIIARHHVTIMFVGNLYVPFACRTIEKFYDGKTKVKDISYSPIRQGKRPVKRTATPQEIKLDFISRLPRVGSKKGLYLLEHFDWSIGKIVEASMDELRTVEGIGEILAKEIHEVLS